jgi:hypothetical protein
MSVSKLSQHPNLMGAAQRASSSGQTGSTGAGKLSPDDLRILAHRGLTPGGKKQAPARRAPPAPPKKKLVMKSAKPDNYNAETYAPGVK